MKGRIRRGLRGEREGEKGGVMAEIHRVPDIMHGNPVFKGTRIPVDQIISALVDGDSWHDVIEGYPALTYDHLTLVEDVVEQITTLRAQLKKHGGHTAECEISRKSYFVSDGKGGWRKAKCDCGWETFLTKHGASDE